VRHGENEVRLQALLRAPPHVGCEAGRETCSERETGTGKLCEIKWDYHIVGTTVPARQPSRAVAFLSVLRGAGGGTPLSIGKQEVTYIYSLLYTHTGLLGRLLPEVLQLLK
jgi:hypothetical protein